MNDSRLLRIGEFARLGGVSIKALRLYAKLGLLEPAAVKLPSRYRLYTPAQLSTLHRILLLKSAGFSLAEIRRQLLNRDEASLRQIRARLVARDLEIQRQLSWLDAEMREPSKIVIKRVPRLAVWSRRQTLDSYDQADVLLRELGREVPTRARLVSGAVWHECSPRSGRIDCEVFWLAPAPAPRGAGAAAPGALAPVTVASILHEGGESTIAASYEAAQRWLRDNRCRTTGANRELYLGAALTEIQFPI